MNAVMTRPAPVDLFAWLDRAPRPALRMAGAVLVFLFGCAIITAAFISALSGRPMPDMTAGCVPLVIGLAPYMMELWNRSQEVKCGARDHDLPRIAPTRADLPSGGLANPHGGPDTP